MSYQVKMRTIINRIGKANIKTIYVPETLVIVVFFLRCMMASFGFHLSIIFKSFSNNVLVLADQKVLQSNYFQKF